MANGNSEKHRNEHFTPVSLTCCSLFCAMRSSTSSIFSWITSWYTWFIWRHVSGSCGRLLSISSSLLSSSLSISLKQRRHLGQGGGEERKILTLKRDMQHNYFCNSILPLSYKTDFQKIWRHITACLSLAVVLNAPRGRITSLA